MELTVKDLRVIVTAGGSGIGRTIAETFMENGARVHICDLVEDHLNSVTAAFPTIGATLTDVSDPAQVERLFDEAVTHLGGLDVLINNAGIAGPTALVEEIQPEDWEKTMSVNINGQFYCTRLAVPLLKEAGGGHIINLSSTAGLFGYTHRSPYVASKWAVIGFTKTLAMELGEFNIRANAICPGSIDGPRMDRVIAAEAAAKGLSEEQIRQGYFKQNSLGTFINMQDIANMALFLCTDAANLITGQALSVDGHTETLRTEL
ncbi:MAG: SDR family oxidoreductase [Chloroflexota bacterium]